MNESIDIIIPNFCFGRKDMTKVSVLMPVYKTQEEYLKKAIESILNQTFKDFEFLILDDCPEDSREDIIRAYNDNRIVYYKNEKNLGISASRNKLLDMAKGEYIAVFDHDDISNQQRLEKQVAYLDSHTEVGVLGCGMKKMSNGKMIKNPLDSHDIKVALMGYCAVVHTGSMIRKEVLTKNNIRYNEFYSPSEDYALWGDLIPVTEFHNLEDILIEYRDFSGNTTHNQMQRMTQKGIAISSNLRAKYPNLYNEFKMTVPHVEYIKLFGLIPLIRKERIGKKTKFYLFKKLLILSKKTTAKF